MRTRLSGITGSGILLAIAALGIARAAEDGPSKLVPTIKAGDSYRIKSTISMNVDGSDITVVQTSNYTIKEIKSNGDAVTVKVDEGGIAKVDGEDMATPIGSPVTITTDKFGKLLAFKPDIEENPYITTAALHLLAMADHIVFPDKAVRPNDSWSVEIDNPAVKGKKITIRTTFLGTITAGAPAWKVKQTLEADVEGGAKMTSEFTALLDPSNGQLISADESVKGAPTKMDAVSWTGKLTRVKSDDKSNKKPAPG